MPVSDSFVEYVIEQLEPLGPLTSKRMFGGVGLYTGDRFFGIVMDDVLYLKSNAKTRASRTAVGARPFHPAKRPRGTGKNPYDSVPAAIVEDSDALLAWARQSIAIAARS